MFTTGGWWVHECYFILGVLGYWIYLHIFSNASATCTTYYYRLFGAPWILDILLSYGELVVEVRDWAVRVFVWVVDQF